MLLDERLISSAKSGPLSLTACKTQRPLHAAAQWPISVGMAVKSESVTDMFIC